MPTINFGGREEIQCVTTYLEYLGRAGWLLSTREGEMHHLEFSSREFITVEKRYRLREVPERFPASETEPLRIAFGFPDALSSDQ